MTKDWNARTKLVHGGTRRSQYNEVSEAIFLTQGFVRQCGTSSGAFVKAGEDEFIYARYGNPTVAMLFEDRIALLEGAEDAFACASYGGGQWCIGVNSKGWGSRRCGACCSGSCLYILTKFTRFWVQSP